MHTTEKHYNPYRKIIGGYGVSLALKLVKKSQSLHKGMLLSIQSLYLKHKHKINKHSNNHTNKWRNIQSDKQKGSKGLGLATR